MGFDNECILNIQSLAGEYFCPVCRLLVYPNEALQSQCTHLYCKPCLTYVVSTTQACPYDGYLVTEADAKPLTESNKALAETIGKIPVHCLFHRSGCTWQGPLSECTPHCSGCAFGNSPVVCNRCGVQIVHRQVQEHGQTCSGVQPAQQAQSALDTSASGTSAATADQTQAAIQTGITTSQALVSQTTTAPGSDPTQEQNSTATISTVLPAVSWI
ncbi:E3 ubiquitin-protein ligase NRDP1 [Pyrus x bretschneideri]|uniref:E3 ubiquitin-protein ligase NRDP1 n=1 Tax=Pyrus x bretschneideri TaxID=225117 RepID=UPI00202F300D|nr:E3 ubiquitin-protein ligase NRDP1 [Pyrus x bretschneideri]